MENDRGLQSVSWASLAFVTDGFQGVAVHVAARVMALAGPGQEK